MSKKELGNEWDFKAFSFYVNIGISAGLFLQLLWQIMERSILHHRPHPSGLDYALVHHLPTILLYHLLRQKQHFRHRQRVRRGRTCQKSKPWKIKCFCHFLYFSCFSRLRSRFPKWSLLSCWCGYWLGHPMWYYIVGSCFLRRKLWARKWPSPPRFAVNWVRLSIPYSMVSGGNTINLYFLYQMLLTADATKLIILWEWFAFPERIREFLAFPHRATKEKFLLLKAGTDCYLLSYLRTKPQMLRNTWVLGP